MTIVSAQKQHPRAWRDHATGDIANGLAPRAQRNDQRTEVMHGADENRADKHPKQRWKPSP